jgi:predicted naringenin-chalcone synthase
MSEVRVLGLGTALPPFAVAQDDLAQRLSQLAEPTLNGAGERLVRALFRKARVRTRHSVLLASPDDEFADRRLYRPARDAADAGPGTAQRMARYGEEAGPLAARAARAALTDSGVAPGAITHLVTVSCTGFTAPGVDTELIHGLALSPDVARTHLGFMGCHGALNGLRVAGAFAAADPAARVLVVAVELCSLHLQYGWDQGQAVANALFADGAAAAVVGASDAGGWRLLASGSRLFDGCADAMTWRIGDHGFEMTLSAGVPDLIARELRPWLAQWLGAQGLLAGDIGSWAVHPGGPRIIDSVEAAMGLPSGTAVESREVLRSMGNMSSPTILFILDRLRRRNAPTPCLALGFGPGLAAEAALLG